MGSGVAFLDVDGDGWQDILFINSRDWSPAGRRTTARLYRNTHDGKFADITAGSGLDVPLYALGVAVADYDNDGRDDVYITALEGDRLFHNEGGGKFPRRHRSIGHPQRRLRHQCHVVRLRSRWQAGPLCRQLRTVESKGGYPLLSRRHDQVLLHSGVLQRPVLASLP